MRKTHKTANFLLNNTLPTHSSTPFNPASTPIILEMAPAKVINYPRARNLKGTVQLSFCLTYQPIFITVNHSVFKTIFSLVF